jgi:hypothetical protein
MIQEHLAMMRRHVADGKEQVARQREVAIRSKRREATPPKSSSYSNGFKKSRTSMSPIAIG